MSCRCLEVVVFIFSPCLCRTTEFVGSSPFPGRRGSMSDGVSIWTFRHSMALSGKGFSHFVPYFFFVLFISRGRHILAEANKAAAQKWLSTPPWRARPRPILSVYCGILTQLSKQEGQSRHRWRLPAVNTRSATGCVCSQLGSTGAHYISVRPNKGQEHI